MVYFDKTVKGTKSEIKHTFLGGVADKISPICVVGHQDQEDYYLHWHLVYANDSDKDFVQVLAN